MGPCRPELTRGRKFLHGVGSGYVVLAVNVLVTLISVPVSLRYLTTDEFGLWVVIGQMAGYLTMVDFGTGMAGMRLLIDHKDAPAAGPYGALIKAMTLIQFVQAGVILIVGVTIAGVLGRVLRIDPSLLHSFHVLWFWQVIFVALMFALRTGTQLLMAHQRMEVSNYAQAGSLVANFVVLWLALASGLKLYSFVLSQGAALAVNALWTLIASARLKLMPPKGAWGKVTLAQFKQIFAFSAELFLVALGTQLILTSQTFLVARWFGLSAASVWGVMTKIFLLLLQIVQRMVAASMPAFSEMIVRKENDRLWKRYRSLFEMVLLVACAAALLLAVANSAFVDLWTHGKIAWHPVNDWLLAFWFLLLTQMCCHNSLTLTTKEVKGTKYIYFIEGALFVVSSALLGKKFGLTGMLLCSIFCTAVCTYAYGTWRVARMKGIRFWEVGGRWAAPATRFVITLMPVAVVLALVTGASSTLRLAAGAVPLAVSAAFVAVRFFIPGELLAEIISHLPASTRRPAQWLAGPKAKAA